MSGLSPYAKLFDRHNVNWNAHPDHRKMFFAAQESYANDLFHRDGLLFLNDVYKSLGMQRSQTGQTNGWARGYPNAEPEVRFRVVEHPDGEIWVDFNVHGYILDQLEDD